VETPAVETPAVETPAPAAEQTTLLRPMEQMFLMMLAAQVEAPAETQTPAPAVVEESAPAQVEAPADVQTPAPTVVENSEAVLPEITIPSESPVSADALVIPDALPADAPLGSALPTDVEMPDYMVNVSIKFKEGVTSEFLIDIMEKYLTEMQIQGENLYEIAPADGSELNQYTSHTDWTVGINVEPARANELFTKVKTEVEATPLFPASQTIGSKVANSMCVQGSFALILSLLGIVLYIWIRFQKVSFGLASTFGLVHNVTIALGLVALSTWTASAFGFLLIDDFKINLTMLAAFLTLIGYSLNDTIIVFDRIREVRGKNPQLTKEAINKSLNLTLSRTMMTSITTFIVSVALYIWGGQTIHSFAFVMTAGIIIGTYSSIFIATPLLYWMVSGKSLSGDDE
ncbi:MAG: protein translocase subunit SecF, partial [Planctomycetia bacterium]|nr:protein translocase subunit SecF [Planctomycetia bacterium]